MNDNNVIDLKRSLIELIEHLHSENFIHHTIVDDVNGQSFDSLVISLRDALKVEYPNTRLKRIMKSIHYANGFSDPALKESAFILDEIEQYLSLNKYLNHDKSVAYFNKRITADNFDVNQEKLLLVMIESMMDCAK